MRASYSAQSFKRQASARFPNSYSVMQRKKSLARAKVAAPADPTLPLISAPSAAEPAEATPPPLAPIAAAPAAARLPPRLDHLLVVMVPSGAQEVWNDP